MQDAETPRIALPARSVAVSPAVAAGALIYLAAIALRLLPL